MSSLTSLLPGATGVPLPSTGLLQFQSEGDPYLQYQPAFTYSLPIQILVSGITLTLLVVLLIHLLFTAQYHYPLAPLNYSLQLSSIITVLIGACVRIGVILHHCGETSDQWPYDLEYVAVKVPGPSWTTGEEAAWYLLQAICNGLANLTHIQFLTLLYPSRIEARLIFFILGPLAIASSVLYFCDLSDHRTVMDMGDAIRNVFSSCLLLIFTLSLCIWGFLVNRNRAWRLDGGTGVFGMGALVLAFATTASSFVAVKEEHIDWLQHLIWAAVLWQTWLGWWWWVGAGMGIGEVEDIMERAIRKRRKAARRAHRRDVLAGQDPNEPAGKRQQHNTMAGRVKIGANNAVNGFTTGLANLLPTGSHQSSGSGDGPNNATQAAGRNTTIRRRTARVVPPRDEEEGLQGEEIELGSLRLREPAGRHHAAGTEDGSGVGRLQPPSSNSETSSTSQTPSLHSPRTAGEFLSFPTTWLQVYFRRLRHAHVEAARKRAVEQAERRKRVPTITGNAPPEDGWGLGAYGAHEHAESTRRLQEAERRLRAGQLINGEDIHDSDDDLGSEAPGHLDESSGATIAALEPPQRISSSSRRHSGSPNANATPSHSRRSSRARDLREDANSSRRASRRPSRHAGAAEDDADADAEAEAEAVHAPVHEDEHEADWEDVFSSSDADDEPRAGRAASRRSERSLRRSRSRSRSRSPSPPPNPERPPRQRAGWGWWGPLREWRLEDRSTF